MIEGIANSGVNSVSGITYDTSNREASKSLARKAALANALKKAKEYADMVNAKLGRILKIDETNESYYPYYTSSSTGTAYGGQLASSATNGMSVEDNLQIPVGKITIIVNVAVTWILIFL